jgi:signal peptidase II
LLTPLVAISTIAVDAATKAWALSSLQSGVIYPFIPGILQLTLTTNTGGAFGIGKDHKEIMLLLAATIAGGIIYWIVHRERDTNMPPLAIERVGLGLLLGGAVGNIWDRLILGKVTDFLDFAFMDFPVFNVADALIDVGVVLIIINSFIAHPQTQGQPQSHE